MLDFVPQEEEITVDYGEGDNTHVTLHDGTELELKKLNKDWNPTDRIRTERRVIKAKAKGEILTGLLYIDPESKDLHDIIDTVKTPLNELKESDLCPGSEVLELLNQGFR